MKKQYDVCVVTFGDIRFDGRAKNLIEALIHLNKKVIVFSLTSVNIFEGKIEHISIPTNYNHRVLFRWISFCCAVKKHLKNINYEIYWASDLYSLPSGCRHLIYDSREIYSKLSVLHSSPIRQKIITIIEKYYIKKINVLITSGKLDSDYLKKIYQLKIPCYEIYNYPKFNDYLNSNQIRKQLNIGKDKIILLYQGVLLGGRGLKPIVDAIKDHNRYVFVIVGEGKYKNILKQYAEYLNIDNRVYFVGNIEYKELHKWTCGADIGICNIEPISFSYKLALPNKLFEYLLAELPVLVTDLPALTKIVNGDNNKLGEIIPSDNNKDSIIAALDSLVINNENYKNNIRIVKENYTYQTQYDLIDRVVSSLLPSNL